MKKIKDCKHIRRKNSLDTDIWYCNIKTGWCFQGQVCLDYEPLVKVQKITIPQDLFKWEGE